MDENDVNDKRDRRKTGIWTKMTPRIRGTGERFWNMDENDAKDKRNRRKTLKYG